MMKSALIFFVLTIMFFTVQRGFSQCSVVSSNGYTVHISIVPKTIIPDRNPCTSGYNYNVSFDYNITFTGSNIPSNMYTLQANIICAGQNNGSYSIPTSGGSGTLTTSTNPWRPISDCNTVTVSICSGGQVIINGPGIPSQTVNCPLAPLPIELLSFNASVNDNKVYLTWKTATEKDNDYFLVEKSKDGKTFLPIEQIEGAGNSINELNYSTVDLSPFSGVSYYRLKQVDFDRNYSYSEIVRVKLNEYHQKLLVYPNPNSSNELNIVGNDLSTFTQIEVISVTGVKVYSSELSSPKVVLPSIPKGIYYLRLTDLTNHKVETVKYVQE